MSVDLVSMVVQRKIGTSLEKFVLLILSDKANHSGEGITLSINDLCAQTDGAPGDVRDALKRLTAAGMIVHCGYADEERAVNKRRHRWAIKRAVLEAAPITVLKGAAR